MSRARGHQHKRRHKRGRVTRSTLVTIRMAVTATRDDEAIESAKQLTHDGIIDMLGDRRRSGVRWRIFANDGDALAALDVLEGPSVHTEVDATVPRPVNPRTEVTRGHGSRADQYEQTRQFIIDHPGGALIVAECDAVLR